MYWDHKPSIRYVIYFSVEYTLQKAEQKIYLVVFLNPIDNV